MKWSYEMSGSFFMYIIYNWRERCRFYSEISVMDRDSAHTPIKMALQGVEKWKKKREKRGVFGHTCYQTCFRACLHEGKCVPLQHPKNNLFTLKKLILIENRKA